MIPGRLAFFREKERRLRGEEREGELSRCAANNAEPVPLVWATERYGTVGDPWVKKRHRAIIRKNRQND